MCALDRAAGTIILALNILFIKYSNHLLAIRAPIPAAVAMIRTARNAAPLKTAAANKMINDYDKKFAPTLTSL
jgi:hypothetical protein